MKKPTLLCTGCLLLLTSLLSTTPLFAQFTVDWVNAWSQQQNGTNIYSQWLASDGNDNLLVTGPFFSGTNDFDPGPDSFNLTSTYRDNIHITKFNPDGKFVWTRQMSSNYRGIFYSGIRSNDIAADANGNVYVTGYFQDTLYYWDQGGRQAIVSKGSLDIFVAKLDSSGNWIWVKTYGGIYDDQGGGVTVTPSGDVYCTGYFADSVRFDPAGPSAYCYCYDLYVLKLNSAGVYQWLYQPDFGDHLSIIEPSAIAASATGGLYITGQYMDYNSQPLDFDPGPDSTLMPTHGSSSGFLLKLDTTGQFQWAKPYASGRNDQGIDLAINSKNQVLLTGIAGVDTLDFDPATLADTMSWSTYNALYLLCLNEDGHFNWVKTFAPTSSFPSNTLHVAVDINDRIGLSGTYDGSVDADPGEDSFMLHHVSDARTSGDGFMIALDPNGRFLGADNYSTSGTDAGYGIAADHIGNFFGVVTVAGLTLPDTLAFGDTAFTYLQSTRYVFKMGSCGTEAVRRINDSTLMADAVNAGYQWLDCDSNYAPVPGATDRLFQATVSGHYALQATHYACTDTSDCFVLTVPSSEKNDPDPSLGRIIYPNPTSGKITIRAAAGENITAITIITEDGRVLKNSAVVNQQQFEYTLCGTTGLYFIQVKYNTGKTSVFKVFKW